MPYVTAPTGSSYYDNVRPLAYPDSDAVLICFDISRPETLDSVLKKVSISFISSSFSQHNYHLKSVVTWGEISACPDQHLVPTQISMPGSSTTEVISAGFRTPHPFLYLIKMSLDTWPWSHWKRSERQKGWELFTPVCLRGISDRPMVYIKDTVAEQYNYLSVGMWT